MPLQRRVPQRGFSHARFKKGVIRSAAKPVKILANGEIERSVEVFADAFSATASEKIEKAGGKAIIA